MSDENWEMEFLLYYATSATSSLRAGGTGAVVKAVCLKRWRSRVRTPLWPSLAFKFERNKMFFPRSLVKIQYCGEPP